MLFYKKPPPQISYYYRGALVQGFRYAVNGVLFIVLCGRTTNRSLRTP